VLALMTGTTIAQAIPIAISPILTRIYTPEDFGLLAIFISIASLLSVIVTAKYELALILPKQNRYAYQLLLLAVLILISISIFYMISILFLQFIYEFSTIYYLLPIVVFFIGLNNIFDKYNNRIKNYKLMSKQRIIKTTVESFISISFAISLGIQTGMIWGFILGYTISSLIMIYINYNYFKKQNFNISKNKIKFLSKRYINFPKYSMPHSFLNSLSANIPIFLIPFYYGSHALGLYAFGLKIIQAPLSLLSNSIFNVLGQKMAEEFNNGNNIKPLFLDITKKLSIIAISLIPLFIFIDDIFAYIFGEEWRIAGDYIQILSPWLLLIFVVSPLSTIPQIYDLQKKAFIIEIIRIIFQISALSFGGIFYNMEITLMLLCLVSSIIITYNYLWYYNVIIKENNE
jgi:O-antigen/teichoic acid export membrane protein